MFISNSCQATSRQHEVWLVKKYDTMIMITVMCVADSLALVVLVLDCAVQYTINQYRLLWINPFRCSRPLFPTEATDSDERVTVQVLIQTREEDHVLETGSNIRPPDLLRLRMPSWILGSTSKRSTRLPRDFPSKIGEGEATALFQAMLYSIACSLMAAPAYNNTSIIATRQGHASILSKPT
jgi:hypothetical protein